MRVLMLSSLLLLAACAETPPEPKIAAPAPYRAAFHAEGAAAPLDRWWSGFQDPVLTSIVERALAQNLDLEESTGRIRQARAAAQAAGARLLPQGSLSTQVSPFHQSLEGPIGTIARHLPGYDRDQVLYDAGAGASWEIDLGGGLQRDAEAAAALAEAAEAEHLGTKVMVAAEAADAYLQLRGDQARIALAEQQVVADAKLADLVKLRLARGAATERELAQSQALLSQARASLPPLRVALQAQLNRLDVLLGRQPGAMNAELAEIKQIPAVPAIDPQDSADLLRRRPDVIAAERRLAAKTALIGSANSDYYPKLSLSALLGFESLNSQQLFTGAGFQPQAVAGLRWRLFDFGRVDAEVASAEGAQAEALAHYRASLLRATEDVENALTALAETLKQNQDLRQESQSLTVARDRAQEAYLGGAVSLIEVLDADRQLLTAEDEEARSRADAARSAVSAFRALGGGW